MMAIFSHNWLMLWRKKYIFINLSWHGGCGQLLSLFDDLEVPLAHNFFVTLPGLSEQPVPFTKSTFTDFHKASTCQPVKTVITFSKISQSRLLQTFTKSTCCCQLSSACFFRLVEQTLKFKLNSLTSISKYQQVLTSISSRSETQRRKYFRLQQATMSPLHLGSSTNSPLVIFLISICSANTKTCDPHLHHNIGFMMEDGNMRGAAPECAGLGWVYFNGHCYLFDR